MLLYGGLIREVFRRYAMLRAICNGVLTAVICPRIRSAEVTLALARFFDGNATALDVFGPRVAGDLIEV